MMSDADIPIIGQEKPNPFLPVPKHKRWLKYFIPRVLPSGWLELQGAMMNDAPFAYGFQKVDQSLRAKAVVFVTGEPKADGRNYIHVAVRSFGKPPTLELLWECKQIFIGKDKAAIMQLPDFDSAMQIHPFLMSLYHCVDKDPLPDLRLYPSLLELGA
jgi:hypothetical protein